jgi:hypothetical protein
MRAQMPTLLDKPQERAPGAAAITLRPGRVFRRAMLTL